MFGFNFLCNLFLILLSFSNYATAKTSLRVRVQGTLTLVHGPKDKESYSGSKTIVLYKSYPLSTVTTSQGLNECQSFCLQTTSCKTLIFYTCTKCKYSYCLWDTAGYVATFTTMHATFNTALQVFTKA